jgi:hypothetical protein
VPLPATEPYRPGIKKPASKPLRKRHGLPPLRPIIVTALGTGLVVLLCILGLFLFAEWQLRNAENPGIPELRERVARDEWQVASLEAEARRGDNPRIAAELDGAYDRLLRDLGFLAQAYQSRIDADCARPGDRESIAECKEKMRLVIDARDLHRDGSDR